MSPAFDTSDRGCARMARMRGSSVSGTHQQASSRWCVLFLTLGALAGWAGAEEVPVQPPAPTEQQMRNAAAEFERRGDPLRAAHWYERLLATNALVNAVVRARLVDIYVEAGQTNEALAHARAEMKSRPDPAAYYAAVLTRVGRRAEAETLLDRELAVETNSTRRARLEALRVAVGPGAGQGPPPSRDRDSGEQP